MGDKNIDSNIDTNIDNYSVSELLLILDLDDPTTEDITEKTELYIKKFQGEHNRTMVSFFRDVQTTLLDYAYELEDENKHIYIDIFN